MRALIGQAIEAVAVFTLSPSEDDPSTDVDTDATRSFQGLKYK